MYCCILEHESGSDMKNGTWLDQSHVWDNALNICLASEHYHKQPYRYAYSMPCGLTQRQQILYTIQIFLFTRRILAHEGRHFLIHLGTRTLLTAGTLHT